MSLGAAIESAVKDFVAEEINGIDFSDTVKDALPDFEQLILDKLGDYDFTDAVGLALDDYDMDQDISKALENFDFSDAVAEAFSYDRRIQRVVKEEVRDRIDDQVGEYMDEYVQSPEFSAKVRGIIWDMMTLKTLRVRFSRKVVECKGTAIKFTQRQVERFRKAA